MNIYNCLRGLYSIGLPENIQNATSLLYLTPDTVVETTPLNLIEETQVVMKCSEGHSLLLSSNHQLWHTVSNRRLRSKFRCPNQWRCHSFYMKYRESKKQTTFKGRPMRSEQMVFGMMYVYRHWSGNKYIRMNQICIRQF